LQIGSGLLRTNEELQAWNGLFRENYRRFCQVSHIQTVFDILRKQSQRVAQTKPTGKSITKTMLQHEQRNQRGHNSHIRAKTALLTQVNGLCC
jgi:hypothetical protein